MSENAAFRILSSSWKSLLHSSSSSAKHLGGCLIWTTNGNRQQHLTMIAPYTRIIGGRSVRRISCCSRVMSTSRRNGYLATASIRSRVDSRNTFRLVAAQSPIRRALHKNNHPYCHRHRTNQKQQRRFRHKNDGTAASTPQQSHSTAAVPSGVLYEASKTAAAQAIVKDPLTNVTTPQKLRSLFITGAIPMIGFGFMDNFVMIQAGQYIDSTIGVQLGLATMTAAACGQVVSDVSGVLMGGTLERTVGRFKYFRKHAQISQAARQTLPWAKNVTLAGAVVGVICGCAMGASTLLLVDLEARDRIHHAIQLRDIVTDMLKIGAEQHCLAETMCTVYVASKGEYTLTKNSSQDERSVRLAFLDDGECDAVQLCEQRREVLTHKDCLCAPILRGDEVVAVLEFHFTSDGGSFTQEHTQAAKVMAHHLGIVMKHLVEA